MATTVYPVVPYTPVYKINTSLPAGSTVTLDFGHVPSILFLQCSLAEVRGLSLPTSVTGNVYEAAPFGMGVGTYSTTPGTATITTGNFTDPGASGAVTTPPALAIWRSTHGLGFNSAASSLASSLGGLRFFSILTSGVHTFQWTYPASMGQFGFQNAEYNASCAWGYHDWGQGSTDYVYFTGSAAPFTFFWDVSGSPVPIPTPTTISVGFPSNYSWFDIAWTKMNLANGTGWNNPAQTNAFDTTSNTLTMTLPFSLTAPTALAFFCWYISSASLSDDVHSADIQKYPQSITDNVTGSTNMLAGRIGGGPGGSRANTYVPDPTVTGKGRVGGGPPKYSVRLHRRHHGRHHR